MSPISGTVTVSAMPPPPAPIVEFHQCHTTEKVLHHLRSRLMRMRRQVSQPYGQPGDGRLVTEHSPR